MPTSKNWFNFAFVNLAVILFLCSSYYSSQVVVIKKNWPLYRCNPMYMYRADNITENFEYCLEKVSKSTFGEVSKKLTDLQNQGFNLQSLSVGNIGSLMNSINFSNFGISNIFSTLLNKSGAINVLMMSIMSVFSDILGKLGVIIASTGGMLNSGSAGLSIVNNEFSKYINMFSR